MGYGTDVSAADNADLASALEERLLARFPDARVTSEPGAVRVESETAEITVVIGEMEADFRLYTLEWVGPHSPIPATRSWRKVELAGRTVKELEELAVAAARARRRQYRVCRYCGERVPVEHRFSGSVCHGCASKELGIVF